MIERTFKLIPFPAFDIPRISISGKLFLENHKLTLCYSLSGGTDCVLLPPVSQYPSRKDELWKATCFEFFLAVKDQPAYWEFNMSPSGDWNVYRMDSYRRVGFRQETAISELPFAFQKDLDKYSLAISVELTGLIKPGQEFQVGITAIIQSKDYSETYWALIHPASHADFHLRESFILAPAGRTLPSPQSGLDG